MPPCNGFALSLPVLCPASTNKCLQLLAIESTLWTFVDLVGIEPTNREISIVRQCELLGLNRSSQGKLT